MRIVPILTAIVVAAVIFGLVIERDRIRAFLSGEPTLSADTAATEDATGSTMPDEGAPTQAASQAASQDASAETDEPERIAVVAIDSRAERINNLVVLRGRTEADRQVEVKAQISGLVISHPLGKGSFVEAGQVLCEIDPGTRPADLAEARARLAEAQISNTAAERLVKGGFTSETQAVSAKAALEAAAAAVTRAETTIERLKITAPFDGILETDSAELGNLLQPGAACATVIRLDPIRLVGFLPETSVDAVELGAGAGARLSNGQQVEGKVVFVSRAADEVTRTFRVDIEVANPDLVIRDGQTAEIAIQAAGSLAHELPQSSLTLNDAGVMGVRVVDDESRAQFVPVEVVRDTTDGILLTGLPETAKVIVIGQEYVTDGVAVTPMAPGERS